MSSLNINSLFEEQDKKVLNRLKLFDDILVQIHNKIKLNSKNKTFYCTHQIPEFLIGKPLYKVEDLRKYLIDSLKRDKFDVLYIHPNLLFISWERLKNNKRSVKKVVSNNNNSDNFKKIDDYNPTGNLLYNDNILSNINSKFS
tara:strand:- start:62 stop:490 length:429 start_codon:yes stop_codon:yes gene_type:complete